MGKGEENEKKLESNNKNSSQNQSKEMTTEM